MTSRKHYTDAAALIARLRREEYDARTLDAVTKGLVTLFAEDNPRFSGDRFRDAAGLTPPAAR